MAHDLQELTDGWVVFADFVDELRQSENIVKLEQELQLEEKYDRVYKNDPKAFIDIILDNRSLSNEIASLCEEYQDSWNKQIYPKNASLSKKLRVKGNEAFKEGSHHKALEYYTKSIQFAPYPSPSEAKDTSEDNNLLTFALANRSVALFALGRFNYCLKDIELSIKYGYPEENMAKLLIRKVKCLHSLSVWANDFEQIKLDLRRLSQKSTTSAALKAEIQHMFEYIEQTKPEDIEKDELETIDSRTKMNGLNFSSANKMLPQAADTVEMAYSPNAGRFIIANKQILFGRPIIVEDPYAFLLCYDLIDFYCYNCATNLYGRGIGCKKCTQILYCSEECRDSNSSAHSIECSRLLPMHESIGVAYLVMKILYITGFQKAIEMSKKAPDIGQTCTQSSSCNDENSDGNHLCTWTEKVYKNDYESVCSLMDHASDYDYDEMFGFCLATLFLYQALKQTECLNSISEQNPNLQKDLCDVMIRHLLQLSTNVIAILDQSVSQTMVDGKFGISNTEEKPIGTGLYPTISLLNHSCKPNVISVFHDKKMVIRASGAIKPGDEVCYCYGPSINSMSRKDRRTRLKHQYYFDCQCTPCTDNEEDLRRALVCQNCQGPLIYNNDLTNSCLTCHASERDISDKLHQISVQKKNLFEAGEKIDVEDYDDAVTILKSCNDTLKGLVNRRNPLVSKVKSELCRAYTGLQNTDEAVNYCLEDLELTQEVYGDSSYETIYQLIKLISLKWSIFSELTAGSDAFKSASAELEGLITDTRQKLKEFISTSNVKGAELVYEDEMQYLRKKQLELNELTA